MLTHVLDEILRLLHPILPFVTEEIFEHLFHEEQPLITAKYPQVRAKFSDEKAVAGVEVLKELIRSVRTIRLEVNTPLSKKIPILVKTTDETVEKFLQEYQNYIKRFTNPKELTISHEVVAPEYAKSAVLTGAQLYLPLAGLVDLEEEKNRLQKELNKWTKEVALVQKKLSNEHFVANAPKKVVKKEREKEKEYRNKQSAVKERMEMLNILKK